MCIHNAYSRGMCSDAYIHISMHTHEHICSRTHVCIHDMCLCTCVRSCMHTYHTCTLYMHTLHKHAHITHRDILKHTCTRMRTLTPNQVGVGHPLLLPAKTTAWPRNTAFHLPNPSPKHTPSHLSHPASPTMTQSKLCLPCEINAPRSWPCPSAHAYPLGKTGQPCHPRLQNLHLGAGVQDHVPTCSLPRMASLGAAAGT